MTYITVFQTMVPLVVSDPPVVVAIGIKILQNTKRKSNYGIAKM